MTKLRIQWIIGAMTLALLGLAAFQFYWIRETLQAKQEQFDASVSEALQAVVRKMEKQEIAFLTNRKLAAEAQKRRLLAIGKPGSVSPKTAVQPVQRSPGRRPTPQRRVARSSPRPKAVTPPLTASTPVWDLPQRGTMPVDAYFHELTILPNGQVQIIEEYIRHDQSASEQVEEMARSRQAAERQYNDLVFKARPRNARAAQQRRDSLGQVLAAQLEGSSAKPRRTAPARVASPQKTPARAVAKAPARSQPKPSTSLSGLKAQFQQQSPEHQSELLKDVFYDLVFKQRDVADRIDRFLLDSLLKDEVAGRGIHIPFEYGVQTAENRGQLLFTSSPGYREDRLLVDGYKASLFPNDLFSGGNFLYVFFPDQKGYIVRQLWVTFATALVLMLIVVGCFYAAMRTIIEQKKISDIKNDFINNMTHEFKTPVSTISLATQMLQDGDVSANPSMRSRYLGIIQDENRRLGQQVEKVLQAALLDRGEVKIKRSDVNLHDIIERVALNISPQIEARQGTLDIELHAEHPDLKADEVHLTNLVFNLLDNANKYSPDHPAITIHTEDATGEDGQPGLRLRVSDQGRGMSREQVARIFEKFYRVPTGNLHDVKGFGLGLSYVKTMVEAHGGQVSVESQLGKGSAFEVFLPR
ncbi:MAG: two-component sensor histidine kinase [Sphingobacteriaceae bacterium]|nr:two-component sensor histidine kinase [Cytophagaceae bacterium]